MTEASQHKKKIKVTRSGEAGDGEAAAFDEALGDTLDDVLEDEAAKSAGDAGASDATVAVDTVEAEAVDDGAPADGAAELLVLVAQRDEYLSHLQRLQAEFDNYRKRVQRDKETDRASASEGVVESLLPVLDNMQRALASTVGHESDQLTEGVQLVAGQLRSVLESHGLQEVEADPGVPFDPNVHEAVLAQPHDEFPEGTVTQVLERGYLLHGRLLRPTKVIVAR